MSGVTRLPGLDGLRGVAVLAVMGFHLNLGNFLNAGFLGVDIFFTVSGFIITALLLQEHARTGRIDFAAFYLRRARRLFPAALVLLLVLVALTPLLLPASLARLREDLPAAFFYVSNWWQVWEKQSYFEAIDQPRLLQHLWSLAVEEQYYLAWPLLALWLLNKTGKQGLGWVAGWIALASTAWMAWLYVTQIDGGDPSRIYLGTDTHLMGLLAGSAMAAWWNPWKARMASLASDELLNLLGTAALAGLIWGMVEVHEGMPWLYEGGFLLAATATCVVIGAATREGTWVDWMLSTPPMLWLGARSYSLYLWHWPVMVWLQPPAQADDLALVAWTAARLALTLVCAEASYRWVEMRWTQGSAAKPWRRSTALFAAAWVLVDVGVLSTAPGTRPESPPTPSTAAPAAQPAPSAVTRNSSASMALTDHAPRTGVQTYERVTLVGDSVLLGASPYLLRRLPAASVEAKVGRQGSEGLKLVQALRQEQQLGDAAVIHLGTNGYLVESQFKELLQHLADRKLVVVVNVYGARRWTSPNNDMIARVSQGFANVRRVDWYTIGQANPRYFVQDGIHLSGSGIHAYYTQIRQALGQPEVMVPGPVFRPAKPALQTKAQDGAAVPLKLASEAAPESPSTSGTPSTSTQPVSTSTPPTATPVSAPAPSAPSASAAPKD